MLGTASKAVLAAGAFLVVPPLLLLPVPLIRWVHLRDLWAKSSSSRLHWAVCRVSLRHVPARSGSSGEALTGRRKASRRGPQITQMDADWKADGRGSGLFLVQVCSAICANLVNLRTASSSSRLAPGSAGCSTSTCRGPGGLQCPIIADRAEDRPSRRRPRAPASRAKTPPLQNRGFCRQAQANRGQTMVYYTRFFPSRGRAGY